MKFCLIYNQISLSLHYQDFMFLRAKNVEKSVIFFAVGYCRIKNKSYLCTPFEKRAADEAESSLED